MNNLEVVAIDLVPLLPGHENGGAKILAMELVRNLARLSPQTKFVLLTQAATHHELAVLDAPNVSRWLVRNINRRAHSKWPSTFRQLTDVLMNSLFSIFRATKAVVANQSILGQIGADLLFCPFTAPIFYDSSVPTVSIVYDLQYKYYPQFFTPQEVAERRRTFEQACSASAAIVVISNYVGKTVSQENNIDAARIFPVWIRLAGRLPSVEKSAAATTLSRFGLVAQRYFLYPANFWPHKNHEILFTAFSMASHHGLARNIKLVCTGEPSARMHELSAAAAALGLSERVVFPGFVDDAALAAVMKHALAVVFPSLFEGFGIPVVEAMAAGCPVACSNRTSLPEVAGGAALLFDPRKPDEIASAIVSLARDRNLRWRLIAKGKRRAKSFGNALQMARQYWKVFEYAAANNPKGGG